MEEEEEETVRVLSVSRKEIRCETHNVWRGVFAVVMVAGWWMGDGWLWLDQIRSRRGRGALAWRKQRRARTMFMTPTEVPLPQ